MSAIVHSGEKGIRTIHETLTRCLPFSCDVVVHPARRNLTVIRGYSRLGGHPDDPQSDPQDRAWFGPHDRLFRQEESEIIDFKMPPPYGEFFFSIIFMQREKARSNCFI